MYLMKLLKCLQHERSTNIEREREKERERERERERTCRCKLRRDFWRYRLGNQKPYFKEEDQPTQWPEDWVDISLDYEQRLSKWNVFILTPQFEFTVVRIYHNFYTAVLKFFKRQTTTNKTTTAPISKKRYGYKWIWEILQHYTH